MLLLLFAAFDIDFHAASMLRCRQITPLFAATFFLFDDERAYAAMIYAEASCRLRHYLLMMLPLLFITLIRLLRCCHYAL